jgi:hypothetical protein
MFEFLYTFFEIMVIFYIFADTFFTWACISQKKGSEKNPIANKYINSKPKVILINGLFFGMLASLRIGKEYSFWFSFIGICFEFVFLSFVVYHNYQIYRRKR